MKQENICMCLSVFFVIIQFEIKANYRACFSSMYKYRAELNVAKL
jgi:hypothetical protein